MKSWNKKWTRSVLGLAGMAAIAVLTSGCGRLVTFQSGDYVTPVKPPPGWIFANTKAPMTVEFNGNPTGSNVTKDSQGEVQYIQLFYRPLSVGFGNIDVEGVAKDGDISEVSYADYEFFNVLGIYKRIRVNVYGN